VWERKFQARAVTPNFTFVTFKMWVYSPEIAKIYNFWYNYANFTKVGVEEGVPGPHPHAKFHRCGFKNVVSQPLKSYKMVIFGTNLPLSK